MTPASVRQAARDIGRVTDFDAKYAATLALVKGDIALGQSLEGESDADLLRQRRQDRWHVGAAVLRPGDRLRAEARAVARHLMPALATYDLTKDYAVGFWRPRPYRALDHLTLEVEPGEVFGFLGPNGAGKTTTLKLLMQLVFPTSGRAELLGKPLGDLSVKRRIGYLPENPYFYDHLTAEELLRYFAGLFGYSRRRTPCARGAAARRSRHRRRAPTAAPQVFERHAAARRHRAGAHQRSGTGDFRRADVGPRSAGPARRPRADPAAARSRLHGLLQLARVERRRGAVQPRRDSGQRPSRDGWSTERDARVPRARLGAGRVRRHAAAARIDFALVRPASPRSARTDSRSSCRSSSPSIASCRS